MKKIAKENFVLTLGPSNKAIERVPSGSTVVFESFDCFSNKIQSEDQTFSDIGWDDVNPATGPLYIEEAEVGDTLKVEILDLEIGDQGA
ncbi:MAG TPA: acetamidase/formamidase family protein, partial [Bacillota bacterium]|nr:acetamidase/formamidase family protein [Bacillota bacterium]